MTLNLQLFFRGTTVSLVLAFASAHSRAYGGEALDAPRPSDAAEARKQYDAGTQAFASKHFVEAASSFEAAAAIRPHGVTLYTAALAWDQASRAEHAADDYARALDLGGLSAQQSSNARDRLASLNRSLGVAVVSAPAGWHVQLDGFTEVPAPAVLHGSPGVHTLVIRAPGKTVERRDVTLEAGQVMKIILTDALVPPLPQSPQSRPAGTAQKEARSQENSKSEVRESDVGDGHSDFKRTLGVGLVGLGVATIAAAVVLGTEALDARDVYNAAPSRGSLDHAASLQKWTNISMVASGVFVAAGVVLVLIPPGKSHDRPALHASATWRGAFLGGSF